MNGVDVNKIGEKLGIKPRTAKMRLSGKGIKPIDSRLRETKLLGTYSPQDIIEMSKAVYKVRIGGIWYLVEVTAKVRKLLIKAGIDYLN